MQRVQVWVVGALAAAGFVFLGARSVNPGAPPASPVLRLAAGEDPRHREADLDAQVAAAIRRLAEKRSVASALARGDLSLRQAADRFRAIIASDPATLYHLRRACPDVTDEVLLYRNVVGFVRGVLADVPPAVLDRLDAELAATFPAGVKGAVPGPVGLRRS